MPTNQATSTGAAALALDEGPSPLEQYLDSARALVIEQLRATLPARDDAEHATLYELVLDYPLREAKGLRPFLAIATCRALGGLLDAVVPSAAALELYHNAFLVHDDIEDGSELRRGAPTLHHAHGVPIAINVGDAMYALTLPALLDNVAVIGLGPALAVLRIIARMTTITVEGQALELDWIRHRRWDIDEAQYVRMVEKKTAHYTFVAPMHVGAACAGRASPAELQALERLARALGVAFQIQDDVLNLVEDEGGYGKEHAGDLWEAKRTIMLLHALASATPAERAWAIAALDKPRPSAHDPGQPGCKTADDVAGLLALIRRYRSLDHARALAGAWTAEARAQFEVCCRFLRPSVHRDALAALVDYVSRRNR